MIPVKRLRHLALVASDLERQLAYYRDIIGLAEVGREQGRIFLASEAGQLSIVLDVVAMEVVPPGLRLEAVVATPSTAEPEPRMYAHENARTTPHSRLLIVARIAGDLALLEAPVMS